LFTLAALEISRPQYRGQPAPVDCAGHPAPQLRLSSNGPATVCNGPLILGCGGSAPHQEGTPPCFRLELSWRPQCCQPSRPSSSTGHPPPRRRRRQDVLADSPLVAVSDLAPLGYRVPGIVDDPANTYGFGHQHGNGDGLVCARLLGNSKRRPANRCTSSSTTR
jgi:hypothetical protein